MYTHKDSKMPLFSILWFLYNFLKKIAKALSNKDEP